jgi:Domain of unknown function DUF29
MAAAPAIPLADLYELDETARLGAMAALAAQQRYAEIDYPHLSEYLTDRVRRDRREVFSRLVVLTAHLLTWRYQPDRRSGSWRGTIRGQRRELWQLPDSGTLRNHAEAVPADAYAEARRQAADAAEVGAETFPAVCVWGVDDLLAEALD